MCFAEQRLARTCDRRKLVPEAGRVDVVNGRSVARISCTVFADKYAVNFTRTLARIAMQPSHTLTHLVLAVALALCCFCSRPCAGKSSAVRDPATFGQPRDVLNDGCRFRDNRTAGVCRLLTDCPMAFEEMRSAQKRMPTSCGFEGKTPIVCCLRQAARNERIGERPSQKGACTVLGVVFFVQRDECRLSNYTAH